MMMKFMFIPEYESAKEVALKNNIPLKELYK